MTSRSSTPSDQDEAAHAAGGNPMASSLAGLPVRPSVNGANGGGEGAGAVGAKAQGSGQLKDFLDLAVSRQGGGWAVAGGSSLR